ncbi:O-antigen/teichoic acid export membrane protein [Dyadobacter jejuensis]|uniref:O-antigen/teichoic acid export membrane protein n=1 Tax=Dyadobacter jejuensis TaxID=1082580 RepID=A0A316AMJ5_9BACT|nr:flippase [Dyadobacter jejuensis]PWJ58781.1 O-antigen/teichoic acid export membrane protein [Dyadobacter jejuensis]
MSDKQNDGYWLKSGILNILQNFSGVFFGFGGFYMLVRVLSKDDFGVWTLFMSVTTIAEAIRSGLIQNALVKYLSSAEESEHPAIITASSVISIIITLICIGLIFVFAPYLSTLWSSPQLMGLLYTYMLVYILSGILTQFNAIEQANLQFQGIFITNFIRQFIFFAVVLWSYVFEHSLTLITLVWVQALAALIGVMVAYGFVRTYFRFVRNLSKAWLQKLFGYGKYAFGTAVSSLLSGTVDQMMLGAMLSPAASGAFNIAVRITNLIDIPGNAIAVVVFPQSSRRMETEGKSGIKYLYEKSVGTTLALVLPGVIFLFLFSDFVIHFIAGEKYADTIPLLQVTLLYCLLIPYGRQFGTILDSIGKTRTTFLVVLGTTIVNLGLNYVLISKIGVMGAAYATLISNILGFAVAQIILKREIGVSLWATLRFMWQFYPEFYVKYIKGRIAR